MAAAETRDWQDVAWEELGYGATLEFLYNNIKGREEFGAVRIKNKDDFAHLLEEQMEGKLLIKNGLVRPNLPRGKLWHATNASNLPSILDTGLKPQRGEQSSYAGLTMVEAPEGYVDLPCTFFAQHPCYAVFKRGIRGGSEKPTGRFLGGLFPSLRKFLAPRKNISGDGSEGPLALLEIDWHELRARGYKIFPAYPDGYPVSRLSPREDLENAIERGENGKLEIGIYEPIMPEPEVITGVYVDGRATMGYNTEFPEFRVVKVKPITGDFQSWRRWNRAVVEASYS